MSARNEKPVEATHEHHEERPGIAHILRRREEVEIAELDRSGHVQRRWLHTADHQILPIYDPSRSNSLFSRSLRDWYTSICDAFLPVGFPRSVSDDYLAYQKYDSLQAFFSTITSLLASRALLEGLGVGDADSSATFALLLTILKDAMSRIATIVFAHRFSLRIEPEAKRFRFLADLFNDTAFFMELYSPLLTPWAKVVALSTGEALRALCGVAAGSSKAALSVHFAKQDNLAELNAKEASQETAIGLLGLLAGTFVVKSIESHHSVVYVMVALVLAHLWTNYLGVRSVCMETFNRQRATILFQEYLLTGKVLTPAEVAHRESILFWTPTIRNQHGKPVFHVEFAGDYSQAMSRAAGHSDIAVVDGPMCTVFFCSNASRGLTNASILLWKGAEARDAIQAWFLVVEVAWKMYEKNNHALVINSVFGPNPSEEKKGENGAALSLLSVDSKASSVELWETMAARGWDVRTQSFETKASIRLEVQSRLRKNQ